MNVYDFDKTIYDGDSTVDFYLHCLRRYPGIILCLPRQIIGAIKYKTKKISKTAFKEEFYCFFERVNSIDIEVVLFWNLSEHKIKQWYMDQHKPDDVIISASPEFLLEEICKRLGIGDLIASRVDRYSGKYQGINCYGEEKVRRFLERYNGKSIDEFYSDSESDIPMKKMASRSYLVDKNLIKRW